MKVFFSLILFSLVLATCQGACFLDTFKLEFKDGKPVSSTVCVDVFDQTRHLIGSTWNTANCFRCECDNDGMSCCHRYGGIGLIEGCKTVINPVTCEQEHYRIDDPSQRCGV
ncbi:PREDICTED: small serum protein 5-like [Thamnophis sirtalis]|uniref:Small serum protein 5-like n=1 Tax=Thamnophis sirtalis TaxID=35019 RepID=A0A6I9YSQ1_9SAUR|nr:PREDICTED: small serum protein 5-like [Thamnophis sirtalis]